MSYTQHYFHMSENETWIKVFPLLFLIQTTEDRGTETPSCSVKTAEPVCLNNEGDVDILVHLGYL